MTRKSINVLAISVALFVCACGSGPQSLILGKWEAASATSGGVEVDTAMKITAEFSRDGTAMITMFGQTLRGTYKLNGENELEWTLNGRTTKSKVNVTATELELTNDENQTIKYKRK